jgi:EAL domain-containing protein (putative c-di-GMP-specific phosphodiesterase class I)
VPLVHGIDASGMSKSVFSRVAKKFGEGAPCLVYQAFTRYSDRSVMGLEALFRWRAVGREDLVPPAALFDELSPGDTSEIFFWVLDCALREMAGLTAWTQFDGVISINVEADQLGDPDLLAHVERALTAHQFPARRLMLEVTERRQIPEFVSTARNINGLSGAGIMLAMDDFGEGYANLEQARKLKPQFIKLSSNMVRNVANDAYAAGIVKMLVAYTREINAQLIVEGIEWAEQAKLLADMGVVNMQGFLFGMPQEVDAWGAKLKAKA